MKIRIMSDLHLEVTPMEIQNTTDADVLVLAGDILVASKLVLENSVDGKSYRAFLEQASKEFQDVVYVAGNHEFYRSGKFYQELDHLQETCDRYGVHFLENKTVTIKEIAFIGCTLWTDFNRYDPLTMLSAGDMMNDYRAITNDKMGYRKLRPGDVAQRHRDSLGYIKESLTLNQSRPCVVVTHHSPSFQGLDQRYRGDHLMNGLYHSVLDQFILDNPQIKLWCHGHTHTPADYYIGTTRVVCNPRGYASYSEYTGWNPELTVELGDKIEQNVQGQTLEVQESRSL